MRDTVRCGKDMAQHVKAALSDVSVRNEIRKTKAKNTYKQ
jgi:hypothetical protein